MTDNEKSSVALTDAEIKQALEDYTDRFHGIIKYVISQASAKEIHELLCGSLELINRQQAEIELLQKLLNEEEEKYNLCAKHFYKAGVKDFAEFLIDKSENGVIFISDLPDHITEIVGDAE